jgi:single-stranded-DNA-specific exonuclease
MYGLLANQMMKRNGHPVAVVNRPDSPGGFVSGSGRAPGWFDIISSLSPHYGLEAIGHRQACGVKVERAELLGVLVDVLREATQTALLTVDTGAPFADLVLGPDADCDANLDRFGPLSELVRRIESLGPFGPAFAEPVVEIAVEPLALRVDRIGTEFQHLRLVTREGLSCLWWNAADEQYDELVGVVAGASRIDPGTLRFTAKLQLDTFRGETRVQAVINDWAPSPG